MYDPHSLHAEEFIDHEEVQETLAWAAEHARDAGLIDSILAKAALCKGLSHREASVLLACELPDRVEALYRLANRIKHEFYGNRIVMFAPLYLSNYCVNSCVYCPYHARNKHIIRKKLTQEEVAREVIALQDMGHKRLALEAGEHPTMNPIGYILDCIRTIYGIRHKNGAIRRVNVNIAATTVEEYRMLKDAGIGTYILFQETYHKQSYEKLHPAGPKHDYAWHTEAMDRAMQGGIDDVGLGVLFGLEGYRYEFAALLMHAEHLEAVHGVGPHTISVPRIKKADDIDPDVFDNGIDDETFARICACIRVAVPYTGMIISTRESQAVREKVLPLGVSQISGASRTSVGGYCEPEPEDENSAQFDVSDRRTLDEVVRWLMDQGHIPSFCTACYREGRTGDRFMSLCKSRQILNCCHPNALLTLKEYLQDYASPATRAVGLDMIRKELDKIPSDKVRARTVFPRDGQPRGRLFFRGPRVRPLPFPGRSARAAFRPALAGVAGPGAPVSPAAQGAACACARPAGIFQCLPPQLPLLRPAPREQASVPLQPVGGGAAAGRVAGRGRRGGHAGAAIGRDGPQPSLAGAGGARPQGALRPARDPERGRAAARMVRPVAGGRGRPLPAQARDRRCPSLCRPASRLSSDRPAAGPLLAGGAGL